MAVFELERELDGTRVPVRSYLFVYPGVPSQDWVVKLRITLPRAIDGDGEIRRFIEQLARETTRSAGG
jgi:hypothetical protein